MKTLFILFLWLLISTIAYVASIYLACFIWTLDSKNSTNERCLGCALILTSLVIGGLAMTLLSENGMFIW